MLIARARGASSRSIAVELGVSHRTVGAWLRAEGHEPHRGWGLPPSATTTSPAARTIQASVTPLVENSGPENGEHRGNDFTKATVALASVTPIARKL